MHFWNINIEKTEIEIFQFFVLKKIDNTYLSNDRKKLQGHRVNFLVMNEYLLMHQVNSNFIKYRFDPDKTWYFSKWGFADIIDNCNCFQKSTELKTHRCYLWPVISKTTEISEELDCSDTTRRFPIHAGCAAYALLCAP